MTQKFYSSRLFVQALRDLDSDGTAATILKNSFFADASSGTTLVCPTPSNLTIGLLAPALSILLVCQQIQTLTLDSFAPSLSTSISCPVPTNLSLQPKTPLLDINGFVLKSSSNVNSNITSGVQVSTGDLIIVAVANNSALSAFTGCTDNASGGSNTYSAAGSGIDDRVNSLYSGKLFYAIAKATETLDITAVIGGGAFKSMCVHVVGGAGQNISTVLDSVVYHGGETTASTTHVSDNITTSSSPAYLFSCWVQDDYNDNSSATNDEFRRQSYLVNPSNTNSASFDRVVPNNGTYNNTVTTGSVQKSINVLAAFKLYGSGTTLPCPSPTNLSIQSNTSNLGIGLGTPVPTNLSLVAQTPSLGIKLGVVSSSTLTLTNQQPHISLGLSCPVPPNLTLTPNSPQIGYNLSCPTPTSLGLTSFAPTLQVTGSVSLICPSPSGLTLANPVPQISYRLSSPSPSALSLASFTPALQIQSSTNLACPAPSNLSLASLNPKLAINLQGQTSALSLTSNSPSLSTVLRPGVATLGLTNLQPNLGINLRPGTANLVFAQPVPRLNTSLLVPSGSLTLTSNIPSLLQQIKLNVPLATLNLTSFQATLRVIVGESIEDLRYVVRFKDTFSCSIDPIITTITFEDIYNCSIEPILVHAHLQDSDFTEDL